MKDLFVGQRVRILWSNGWPELAGQAGRIVGRADDAGVLGDSEWDVAPDAWGSPFAPRRASHGASFFSPNACQLEPILDPGREVISWSAMEGLWVPGGVVA